MSEYSYSWTPSSNISLEEFLKKNKPSMVVDDGTKPWIWVRRVEHEPLDETDLSAKSEETSGVEQAKQLLEQYTEKIVAIQKDDSIPVRSNKKKGLKSKKEVREEVMVEAANEFKKISQEKKLTCGKWLFFATPDHIDALFARLAQDLVTGVLSKTPAFCAKVATTPPTTEPHHRYLICLYLPDLYNKDAVTEVLRTVCQSVGVRPNSAKTDLYTMVGLDSKHPSGIKSTIWNPPDLIPEAELKPLVEAYWTDVHKKDTKAPEANEISDAPDKPKKKNTRLKRKASDSDDDHVFDEVDAPTPEGKMASIVKEKESIALSSKDKLSSGSKSVNPPPDDSATESESDDTPPIRIPPSPKDSSSATAKPVDKPKADDSSSEEETTKRPKKVRRF